MHCRTVLFLNPGLPGTGLCQPTRGDSLSRMFWETIPSTSQSMCLLEFLRKLQNQILSLLLPQPLVTFLGMGHRKRLSKVQVAVILNRLICLKGVWKGE